jgi:hypothetical protein
VRKEGDGTVYRLDGWTVDQLAPKDSTLRKKAPAKPATPERAAGAAAPKKRKAG